MYLNSVETPQSCNQIPPGTWHHVHHVHHRYQQHLLRTGHSPGDILSNQDPNHFADEKYKAAKMTENMMHASPAAAFKRLLGKSLEKEDMRLFVS